MKDINTTLVDGTRLPEGLLDSMDQLDTARNLAELIGMAHRGSPHGDSAAVAAGVYAMLGHLNAGIEMLEKIRVAQK